MWHPTIWENIGNVLGGYIKADINYIERDTVTYAKICVELDFNHAC